MLKKIVCIITVMLMGIYLCACGKKEKGKVDFRENGTHQTEQLERQALAVLGVPDEGGYYSIDLPRAQEDVSFLEDINTRLYFVSVEMAAQEINEFSSAPDKLVWGTLLMEISFNYGGTQPFKESADQKSTTISLGELVSFAEKCFKTGDGFSAQNMPDNFSLSGDTVNITYRELEASSPGFVMTAYKQDGKLWHIKGEIIGADNTIYTKGEFVVEQNSASDIVSYKILSFDRE